MKVSETFVHFWLVIKWLPRRRRGSGGGDRRMGLEAVIAGLILRTGAAVISCPSICPPSMCFIAVSASSAVVKSM